MVRVRPPLVLRWAGALPLLLLAQTPLAAQTPELEVFYTKLDPKEQFHYKWKGKETTTPAGVFRWEVPNTEFGTNGFDRNFTGYCAEVLVPIQPNKTYKFKVNSIHSPENYGVQDHPNADRVAARRAKQIQELFGRHYQDPLKEAKSDDLVAFQLALWELIQETEPAEGEPKLDLFAGDFQADYSNCEEPPAFVLRAQEYLDSLTGDERVYYENPDTRGRELIRLKGVPNAEGEVAQSQFALRFAGGGGTGSLQRPLTGEMIPGAGSGGSGGGSGAGGGAGIGTGNGALITGNPLGGSGQVFPPPGTTTPPSTTPPIFPPIGAPPTGTPPNTPTPLTTPVPAPAGLILGALAICALATREIYSRLRKTK
ncbi:MAG: hypothetical protein L0241_20680 [Planctomycetia bacterium]|nr:hypothetical protein [Planctomycetia bacterium]